MLILLLRTACAPCFGEDFPWGWLNLNPAGDVKKVQAISEPLIAAAKLPAGCQVGIGFAAGQDTEGAPPQRQPPDDLALPPPPTPSPAMIKETCDALSRVDCRISDKDRAYAYLAAYVRSALSLRLARWRIPASARREVRWHLVARGRFSAAPAAPGRSRRCSPWPGECRRTKMPSACGRSCSPPC